MNAINVIYRTDSAKTPRKRLTRDFRVQNGLEQNITRRSEFFKSSARSRVVKPRVYNFIARHICAFLNPMLTLPEPFVRNIILRRKSNAET